LNKLQREKKKGGEKEDFRLARRKRRKCSAGRRSRRRLYVPFRAKEKKGGEGPFSFSVFGRGGKKKKKMKSEREAG